MTKATKNEVIDEDVVQCAIVYTDGGSRPNPGYAGWGLHGYVFKPIPPKKGAGHNTELVTAAGYWPKNPPQDLFYNPKDLKGFASAIEDELWKGLCVESNLRPNTPPQVTLVNYLDGFGSFPQYGKTNNMAEIVAMTRALEQLAQYDIKHIQVFADSEYAIKGLLEWRRGWEARNFVKNDGSVVGNSNEWKQLFRAYDALINRGVIVQVDWIAAHSDHLGNELADFAATIGVQASRRHQSINDLTVTEPDGYWKTDVERHPMLSHRRMYFNTLDSLAVSGEYYLGEHGKVDDFLGKRIVDGSYALVRLKEPNPALEWLRTHQSRLAGGRDELIMARLDFLFSSGMYRALERYGELAIMQDQRDRLDLSGLSLSVKSETEDEDDTSSEEDVELTSKRKASYRQAEPLTRELRPAKLAMRAIEAIEELAKRLDQFKAGDQTLVVTDLTEILYERSSKKVGKEIIEVMTLNPKYNVGFTALTVPTNYGFSPEEIKTVDVTLTLGIDCLDRNALKRLEAYQPKISLITWMESNEAFRYATVIESNDGSGIWAGVYANIRFIKSKP